MLWALVLELCFRNDFLGFLVITKWFAAVDLNQIINVFTVAKVQDILVTAIIKTSYRLTYSNPITVAACNN